MGWRIASNDCRHTVNITEAIYKEVAWCCDAYKAKVSVEIRSVAFCHFGCVWQHATSIRSSGWQRQVMPQIMPYAWLMHLMHALVKPRWTKTTYVLIRITFLRPQISVCIHTNILITTSIWLWHHLVWQGACMGFCAVGSTSQAQHVFAEWLLHVIRGEAVW